AGGATGKAEPVGALELGAGESPDVGARVIGCGTLARCARSERSEAVSQSGAHGIHALVVAPRQAAPPAFATEGAAEAIVEPVAKLGGWMKQHRRAQRLAVGSVQAQLAIVDGGAQADGEEDAPRRLDFPAQVGVGFAGVGIEVDGAADGGPQIAAKRS